MQKYVCDEIIRAYNDYSSDKTVIQFLATRESDDLKHLLCAICDLFDERGADKDHMMFIRKSVNDIELTREYEVAYSVNITGTATVLATSEQHARELVHNMDQHSLIFGECSDDYVVDNETHDIDIDTDDVALKE